MYAHKINTLGWHDINDAEQFGFAKGQVTPFTIPTPDGQTLYAWHVLPVDAYVRNEKSLRDQARHTGPVEDVTQTLPFRLLTSISPSARVVINCEHYYPPNLSDSADRICKEVHGNAGHVAQGWRTDTYRSLTLQPDTHVLTIDYRGFGHSTGSPTEAGLIADGTALLNWVMHTAKIPPERIVILGQSLGTAVSSAVALNFVDPSHELISRLDGESKSLLTSAPDVQQRTAFAGIILVAPFSSLPSLMLTYRIGGIFPILLPLRPFPWLANSLTSNMVDTWPSAARLAAYYQALGVNQKLLVSRRDDLSGDGSTTTQQMGGLQVIHATNDMDISYHQTEIICQAIMEDNKRCINGSHGAALMDVKEPGKPRLRFQILEHGGKSSLPSGSSSRPLSLKRHHALTSRLAGHNRVITYSSVAVAVARAFEGKYE